MLKPRYHFLLIWLLFVSFTSKHGLSSNAKGDYYFNFDELVHYKIEIEDQKVLELRDAKIMTIDNVMKFEIMGGLGLSALKDSVHLDKLQSLGFTQKSIEQQKLPAINELFKDKPIGEFLEFMCSPIYRDLLVFKRNGRIIGMAKICFSCGKHIISGTEVNTNGFGQNGDYSRLEKILSD